MGLVVKQILLVLIIAWLLSGCAKKNNNVPFLGREDVVRSFFALIDEKRIPEAVEMMSNRIVSNENAKQEWAVQFNDFDSIKVINVEKSIEENLFKVTLEVRVNQRAENYPIPYYGYSNKSDVRFIKLVKNSQGLWKIDGIGTGP